MELSFPWVDSGGKKSFRYETRATAEIHQLYCCTMCNASHVEHGQRANPLLGPGSFYEISGVLMGGARSISHPEHDFERHSFERTPDESSMP